MRKNCNELSRAEHAPELATCGASVRGEDRCTTRYLKGRERDQLARRLGAAYGDLIALMP